MRVLIPTVPRDDPRFVRAAWLHEIDMFGFHSAPAMCVRYVRR